MELYPRALCQFGVLIVLFTLLSVRQSGSTFVPGRCLCPRTQPGVRGPFKELSVYPKSPSCDKMTVIVTLKRNNEPVCVSPEGPMGKQMIRCWNRAHKLGRNVKLCLRRSRRRAKGQRQRPRQRHRGQQHSESSSTSQ
ncbi:C-X-C motif chemokine 10-like [Eucyclogobius newberryi]|uniref:C-X-C motif chemokine 10-like n=1 Tax=Eucyclogobius newberryi TaxID=166745 RepID=UPI003B5A8F89